MFKKHMFLVLIFLFVFGLYACGERRTTSNGKTTETGQTQTPGTSGPEIPGSGSNGEQTDKPGTDIGEEAPAVPETGIVADTIKRLEKEGKYPVLDRSGTLLGTDANNNGIRDDIENYIDSLPLDNNQKSALMQNAYAFNYVLSSTLNPKSEEGFLKFMHMYGLSTNCAEKYLGEDYQKYFRTIEAFTFNTRKRLERYMQIHDAARNVDSLSLVMEEGCDERFFNK